MKKIIYIILAILILFIGIISIKKNKKIQKIDNTESTHQYNNENIDNYYDEDECEIGNCEDSKKKENEVLEANPSIHPSWDKNNDGINDCEKEGICDHSIDYTQPRK